MDGDPKEYRLYAARCEELAKTADKPEHARVLRKGRCVSFQFRKASPFRPRIAQTMPHLGQCDAIATERYISPAGRGRTGVLHAASFRNRDSWGRDIR
jgi:hypothetical protein